MIIIKKKLNLRCSMFKIKIFFRVFNFHFSKIFLKIWFAFQQFSSDNFINLLPVTVFCSVIFFSTKQCFNPCCRNHQYADVLCYKIFVFVFLQILAFSALHVSFSIFNLFVFCFFLSTNFEISCQNSHSSPQKSWCIFFTFEVTISNIIIERNEK